MRRGIAAALVPGAAVFLAGPALAATLVIEVTGLRSVRGSLHYAVYDLAESFPTRNGRVASGQPEVTGRRMVIRVPELKPGRHAVALFHDENGNDAFDQGLFGIPLEDYAFSNNAMGFFAAPSFDAASFALTEPETRILIQIDE